MWAIYPWKIKNVFEYAWFKPRLLNNLVTIIITQFEFTISIGKRHSYTVSWRASFWKFFVSRCCFRLGNSISTPYLLIYFERIGFLRIERHLAGFLTVRNKSITEKFQLTEEGSVNSDIRVPINTFETNGFL